MAGIGDELARAAVAPRDDAASAKQFLVGKLGFVPAGDPIEWAKAHGWSPSSSGPAPAPAAPASPPQWSPQMEAQYKEYRRGGAAGPPGQGTLWAKEFDQRIKREMQGGRGVAPNREGK